MIKARLSWVKIIDEHPPKKKWLEFYDGNKTMNLDHFNHIDIIDNNGDCLVNYIHNYTHWRLLSSPDDI